MSIPSPIVWETKCQRFLPGRPSINFGLQTNLFFARAPRRLIYVLGINTTSYPYLPLTINRSDQLFCGSFILLTVVGPLIICVSTIYFHGLAFSWGVGDLLGIRFYTPYESIFHPPSSISSTFIHVQMGYNCHCLFHAMSILYFPRPSPKTSLLSLILFQLSNIHNMFRLTPWSHGI